MRRLCLLVLAFIVTGVGCSVAPSEDAERPSGPAPVSDNEATPAAPAEAAQATPAQPDQVDPPAQPEPQAESPAEPALPGEPARVLQVIDGDTIEVELNDGTAERVRYTGIDAPETDPDLGGPFPWGPAAREENARLLAGGTVFLEADAEERDRFGRVLRYVWVRDGDGYLLVNQALVAAGLASVTIFPPNTAWEAELREAEAAARAAERGIWTPSADPCDASYPDVCIPPYPPDLDCGDVAFRRFRVVGADPHGFDRDQDGVGCESG